ncbi:hypothetical protein CRG98_035286 [Punica granatum]|uniref:Pentatricopeptide repeat-containing protein At1g09190 n=1 Tax=Punica granatum TaxID=22663 RepID=A0A2I0IKW1_PUNGR|nr:hypothetical protein CRG98_035286 [Punica granatum]
MGKLSVLGRREAERTVFRLLHGHDSRTHLGPIHGFFLRHGLEFSNQILAHFVSVCGSLNKMPYAHRIFSESYNPNILLFNSMIKGYSISGPFEKSLELFSDMKSRWIWPDEYTFTPLLKACSSIPDIKLGRAVHGEIIRDGYEYFSAIQIGIIELYTNCGTMGDAKKMFDGMPSRDVIVWNMIIRGFCRAGHVDMGLNFFKQMSERNVVSWNTMISCLGQSGRDREALRLFHEMKEQGFEPDEATVVTLLPICARSGAAGVGCWIDSYAKSSGLFKDSLYVGNAIVDFHCKRGDLETATQNFTEMPCKNVVSWNAIITGRAFNGRNEQGIELFEKMMEKGVTPNHATFVGVLTCCSHAGFVEKAREVFTSMRADHGLEPRIEHYGCMVDLLGRNGCVREAYELIREMPMEPNAALWGSLLSACRIHGDLELAEAAIKELIRLEPRNSGNYVLLSNLYAETGRWDEVEKLRDLMSKSRVEKVIGSSSVG